MDSYHKFLEKKQFDEKISGFDCNKLNPLLKDFQEVIVKWALKRGRAAIFADTGLGKTFMQCEWAHRVVEKSKRPVMILAPLAVAKQTTEDAAKFGIEVTYLRSQPDIIKPGIYITNYEMESYFDPENYEGIVLDESSILKNQQGKTRTGIIKRWGVLPYRLSCTATPSPNDYMELGNQSEFLGIMLMKEMLAMFFINDSGKSGSWRLKKHSKQKFWEWMATWACVIRKPSDLGFDNRDYDLPPLNLIEHTVESDGEVNDELFKTLATTLTERRKAKRDSIENRTRLAADLVNGSDDKWLVWCYLNDESTKLAEYINNNVEVRGSDKMQDKEERLMSFQHGNEHCLITKPSIAGFGLNFQHTHNMIFVGLDDSFEKYYQAVRRQWRFGQKNPVNVHIIISDKEGSIKENIERKQDQHDEISRQMINYMGDAIRENICGASLQKTLYQPKITMRIPEWMM